jgi:Flp pilus assembly protein TadG
MLRPRGAPRKPPNDSGMVTVETVIALMAFFTVLAMALSTISAAIDQLKCTDAAREAARLTARGETEKARSTARQIAPQDATIKISTTGEEIHVSISAKPSLNLIPGVELHAEAYAISEPTIGATP